MSTLWWSPPFPMSRSYCGCKDALGNPFHSAPMNPAQLAWEKGGDYWWTPYANTTGIMHESGVARAWAEDGTVMNDTRYIGMTSPQGAPMPSHLIKGYSTVGYRDSLMAAQPLNLISSVRAMMADMFRNPASNNDGSG